MANTINIPTPFPSIMMPTFRILPAVACVIAYAISFSASAQQPSETPPKLEKLEEGEAPAITIRKPDTEKKITEKRKQGKVTEVKVHSGKSTYYLKSNEPSGSAQPGDAQSNAIRAPQWQVKEFDLGGVKQAKEAEAEQTPAPPPASEPQKK